MPAWNDKIKGMRREKIRDIQRQRKTTKRRKVRRKKGRHRENYLSAANVSLTEMANAGLGGRRFVDVRFSTIANGCD
jgi:hypothetical protein